MQRMRPMGHGAGGPNCRDSGGRSVSVRDGATHQEKTITPKTSGQSGGESESGHTRIKAMQTPSFLAPLRVVEVSVCRCGGCVLHRFVPHVRSQGFLLELVSSCYTKLSFICYRRAADTGHATASRRI